MIHNIKGIWNGDKHFSVKCDNCMGSITITVPSHIPQAQIHKYIEVRTVKLTKDCNKQRKTLKS